MDWLDQYLDGLGNYKTTVSPADTHMWGVKPKLNNTQQRMIFDATAQSELEYRQLVQEARADLEEHGMSQQDVEEGIGADPGSAIVGTNLSYNINGNDVTVQLPGNASQFDFTVSNSTSSFNVVIAGYGSFSILNNYDANNFENCNLSAYNFNNFSITFNPVYVTATETFISNGQYFTIYYSNTGSALFSIFKSEIIEPVPTPSPTQTPSPTRTPSPTQTPSPTRTPSPTQTPSPTRTPSPTQTPSPTRTPTPTLTPTPTASPAAAIAGFGVPNNIIVASNREDDIYRSTTNGTYTKKSPGNNLTTSAPVFVLSGTGCGYSCIHGGSTFICSPSSFVMYNGIQVSQPQSVWAYINFSIDVYGNPNWNIINSQPDATDINNMPTFWAKNGGAGNYTGIISVCLSAESVTSYLPISTQQFYINQIQLVNYGDNDFNAYNQALYLCQPLTAAAIDSDGTTATGKMVWRGSRILNTVSSSELRLFVTYGKYAREAYYGGFKNDGRPYWRVFFYNTAYFVKDQTMMYNFNTSGFGIPLSGWNSTSSYTDTTQFNAGNGRNNYPVFRTSLSAVTFGTPQKIIVANNQDRDTYQNGSYTRKSTGNTLVPAPATAWQLSGTGYGYSNDLASVTATDVFNGGHTFIVSPSSYIVHAETGVKSTPIGQWSYINAKLDVYGNPVITTENSQSDATDNNNMPTYWAKNGGPNYWYNGILSVCVSAESVNAYLPITTQMLSISGITMSDSGYNDALYFCQPLTAAAIDSDGSGATGKMVWQGSRIFSGVSSSTQQLLLTFGIHKSFSSGTILNAGRPYWRLALKDSRYGASDASYKTLMANYNTSAFGIPLSGWNLDPNTASSIPYTTGRGRSNYPILSAATTVASRNSVNVTGSTYSGQALNQGNGVYTKTSEGLYRAGAFLEGTVYATSDLDMRIQYDMNNKYWIVLDATGSSVYYNPYQGTSVIPQSGWKNHYVNTPSTFTVR